MIREHHYFSIFCNKCIKHIIDPNDQIRNFDTRREAVEFAKNEGWLIKGDNAYCPKCKGGRE